MPLGSTANRQARNARRRLVITICGLSLLVLSGCSAAGVIRVTPEPTPTPISVPTVVRPTPRPLNTPVADTNLPVIERVVLAASVAEDGAPKDESSVFPEHPQKLYLCVETSQLKANTTFRAIWFENGQIIGQSDNIAAADIAGQTWTALGYSPVFALNPTQEHAVELVVNKTSIDRYVFRVGVGDARDVVAQAALALSTDANSAPVGASTSFYIGVQQIVLWVRISNEVDPTGITFATVWYRGSTQIAQIGPDGGQPQLPPTPTPASRRMTFTYVPPSQMTPGDYHVDLYLNGLPIATYSFTVSVAPPPTPTPTTPPTPTPSPTPAPTPTSPPSTATPTPKHAEVQDLAIVLQIDPGSQAPIGPTLFELQGAPSDVVKPWIAVKVAKLSKNDTLTLVVTRNGAEYGARTLKAAQIDLGWISSNVGLDTPAADGEPYTYTVVVMLNGERTLESTFVVRVSSGT